jgi:glycerol-3-phosphate dehydrogenase
VFPAPWRERAWTRAVADVFDLVVVGGGITGSGVARDAALRGLRVALFEREDFGSGTSSRSSRLVHGGVRYLEHGHLRLVLESSRERRLLLRLAPHLVRPLAFLWPVYAAARIPRWKLGAGLALYDALALFRNVAPHRRLAPADVQHLEPALRSDALRGGAQYYDAAADDARLVLANAMSAAEQGSVVLNYASVVSMQRASEGWSVDVSDAGRGTTHRVRSRCVVFAMGPWSDDVPRIVGADSATTRVVGSIGAHIALPRHRVGNAGALTLMAPHDGRVFFVLPAREQTIVTTTESPARERPEDARASREDVQYLIDATNHFFPDARLSPDDVTAAWAGVRPLAAPNADADLDSASREHTISEVAPRAFGVTGGKLTTFRAMAEDVVDRVVRALPGRFRRCSTRRVPLPGGEIRDFAADVRAVQERVGDARTAERIVAAYGSRWPSVLDRADLSPVAADLPYAMAQIAYAVEHEMALTLADVLLRRVPLAFEQPDHGVATAGGLAERLAARWGWSHADARAALAQYEGDALRHFAID